ncbi:MAG TPA: GYD domain-containing protein [Candidatus Cybelea sp.]|jgi:uncharacterized protein with GYD domain
MPKFLVEAKYTASGTEGLLKSSASARRKAVEELMASLGGKLESFYFSFGGTDAVIVVDLPSNEVALSVAFAVRASGMVHSATTPLISVEEADRAVEHHAKYRPPGA